MKLPTVWLAAALATGIALASRWPAPVVSLALGSIATMLVAGILLWHRVSVAAWTFALASWLLLGALATNVERTHVPANRVTQLMAQGRIDLNNPLRWRGRLREDPISLPWGHRYEIDLEQVGQAGEEVPVSGGLRISLYGQVLGGELQTLRAGDRVEALLKARPPRNFLDPGAFDLRGYLARESIDLVGSLRSAESLQLIDRPRPTFAQRLARMRGTLLSRLDALFPTQPEQRFGAHAVRLLRTDRDGAITAMTDGHALSIRTSVGYSPVD